MNLERMQPISLKHLFLKDAINLPINPPRIYMVPLKNPFHSDSTDFLQDCIGLPGDSIDSCWDAIDFLEDVIGLLQDSMYLCEDSMHVREGSIVSTRIPQSS